MPKHPTCCLIIMRVLFEPLRRPIRGGIPDALSPIPYALRPVPFSPFRAFAIKQLTKRTTPTLEPSVSSFRHNAEFERARIAKTNSIGRGSGLFRGSWFRFLPFQWILQILTDSMRRFGISLGRPDFKSRTIRVSALGGTSRATSLCRTLRICGPASLHSRFRR